MKDSSLSGHVFDSFIIKWFLWVSILQFELNCNFMIGNSRCIEVCMHFRAFSLCLPVYEELLCKLLLFIVILFNFLIVFQNPLNIVFLLKQVFLCSICILYSLRSVKEVCTSVVDVFRLPFWNFLFSFWNGFHHRYLYTNVYFGVDSWGSFSERTWMLEGRLSSLLETKKKWSGL